MGVLDAGVGSEAAALVGYKRDTEPLSRGQVEATARRLGVATDSFGLPIGRAVSDNRLLFSDFEAVSVVIAGPRTGKTTCWVVPRILAAPGLVVATVQQARHRGADTSSASGAREGVGVRPAGDRR